MGMPFGTDLLGWKRSGKNSKNKLGWRWVPNTSDTDNVSSLRIAGLVLEYLGCPNPNVAGAPDPDEPPSNPGSLLETQVAVDLATELPQLNPLVSGKSVKAGASSITRNTSIWQLSTVPSRTTQIYASRSGPIT